MPNLEICITEGEVFSSINSDELATKAVATFPMQNSGEDLVVSPIDIWSALISCTKQAVKDSQINLDEIHTLHIDCQLDLSVFWDDETLGTVRDAIGNSDSHIRRVERAIETDQQLAGTIAANRLVTGTLPEYLISRMTRGLHTTPGKNETKTDATAFCGIEAAITA